MSRVREAQITAGFAYALPRFLRTAVTGADARLRIADALAFRERSFVDVVERGVFGHEPSPFRRLLVWAGIELGDVRRLVDDVGVEGTLQRLFDAGVRLSLDEFKGRQPIVRDGLEVSATLDDFANPLATRHFDRLSGGSRGVPRRVATDLRLLAHEAAYHRLVLDALGLGGRPTAVWSGAPPESAGIRTVLRHVKAGERVDRWLIRSPIRDGLRLLTTPRMLRYAVRVSRLVGPGSMTYPEHAPLERAPEVARWLAAHVATRRPALLDVNASAGVRVCAAAADAGLDLTGTWLRFGGEPFTRAKADVVEATGAKAITHYSMAELGRIGFACTTPEAIDDVHLLTDKLAFVQRDRAVGGGRTVPALSATTLMSSCPTIMLNVELDDYGRLQQRPCGCPLGALGLDTHLDGIRSYEKLTSEGLNFLGHDLVVLIDEVLPRRFGGAPSDYQLVEEEVGGLPRISIVISERVGDVDDDDVVDVVLETLARDRRNAGVEHVWREGGTLAVARREPYETSAAKILPLHVVPRTHA